MRGVGCMVSQVPILTCLLVGYGCGSVVDNLDYDILQLAS